MSNDKRDTIKMVVDAKGTIIMSGAFGTAIIDADVAREIATMVSEHRGTVQRGEVLGRLVVAKPDPPKPTFDNLPEPERSLAQKFVERGIVGVSVSVQDSDRERLADAGKLVREWTVRTPMGVPIMSLSHEPTDDDLRKALERADYYGMDEVDEDTEIDDLEISVSYWLSPEWQAELKAMAQTEVTFEAT